MAERMGVKCLNTFAFDMFHVICSESTKNEFISPFSVLTALNMALVGANKNTKKEMFEGLRYNLGFSDTFEVHCFFKKLLDDYKQFDLCNLILANRALLHKSPNFRVNPDYAAHIAYFYGSELNEANFITDKEAIIHTCNEWVNEMTNGKIPSILNSLHRDDSSACKCNLFQR
ncbi:leukocyte elastase inhibitor-like isoform X1 [Leptotrombidium deliense]|uniref:Leukocyte elastase inhibitor-like isoform X1 n=1 Tax=Leptotrombidium deliense TaxID=299467 RepID=A0A443S5S6_9ACAR|nr:leukocyte elastase inhibitor-like isoform X1 [Leptotrombidium deliense]